MIPETLNDRLLEIVEGLDAIAGHPAHLVGYTHEDLAALVRFQMHLEAAAKRLRRTLDISMGKPSKSLPLNVHDILGYLERLRTQPSEEATIILKHHLHAVGPYEGIEGTLISPAGSPKG